MNTPDARSHALAPRFRGVRGVFCIAVAVLLAGLAPTHETKAAGPRSFAATPAAAPAPTRAEVDLQPTVQYEETLAHQGDTIAFEPGGLVTVPFAPRTGDAWPVSGGTPRALPIGRATGRQMAAAPQGSTWSRASGPGDASRAPVRRPDRLAPIDQPTVGASVLGDAVATSLTGAGPSGAFSLNAATSLRRQVFGFLPYWELVDSGLRLDYDLLSTIAYFSVGVARDGDLLKRNPDGTITTGWAGWTSSRLATVINAAHRGGTRVVLTLSMFAWTTGSANAQASFLADPVARGNLARQAAAAVRDRGADGINLDFEPLVAGHEDDFVALVRSIRAQLDAISPGYQLTFDTMGRIGNYPIDTLTAPGAADAVFIMGYDYRTAGSPVAGSIAPLTGPTYDLTETVLAYLDEVPASKIILGVPWYGRAWSTVSDELNARTQSGPKYGPSAAVPYDQALQAAASRDVRWDGREATSWFAYQRSNCSQAYGCVTSWRQVYFDDDRALRLKYDLVNRYGIRGVGIWALGYEGSRGEPWTGLADKFLRDTTPPEAGIVTFPQDVPDEGFLVDWTARDDYNGVVDYDVQASVDGGPWAPWLTGTKAGADVWLGQDGHGYAFRVRAKDGKGNIGPWETVTTFVADPVFAVGGFARVLVDGLTARAKPDTTARQRATLEAGDLAWITDGPVSADGYTWYQVVGPLAEWNPVSPVQRAWVAAQAGNSTFLAPVRPPNTTRVVAGIAGLSFGAMGAASVGSTPAAASRRALSPNADGSQDSLRLDWHARVPFASLTLNVFRADGTLVGSRDVPARAAGDQSFTWDGRVGDVGLTDGTYLLQLVGTDGKGTYAAPSERPVTPSQLAAYAVTIDTVAPTGGTATISGRRISPNGDGRLDALTVKGSAVGANRWSFTVAPVADGVAGQAVRAIGGAGAATTVAWDGKDDAGATVPDGVYRVSIRTLDWAGNGPGASWDVVVDSRAPAVTLGPLPPSISPNDDGSADRAAISWTSDEPVRGEIRIVHGSTLVRRWKQSSGTTGSIAWDGTDQAGTHAADGRYAIEVELTDASGNRVVRRAGVTVDRTVGKLRWSPTAFLPDGDSLAETADLSFRLTRGATTSLRIEDATGRVVRNAWKDRARGAGMTSWTWDGRDGHHDLVVPGGYVAVLGVASKLGVTELRRTVVVGTYLVTLSTTKPAAGDTVTAMIRAVEPLRSTPTVTLTQAGLAPAKVKAKKTGPGAYTATLTIAAGSGPATLVVAARDTGGGTNVTRLALTVR